MMLLTCVSACCCVSACARRWRGSHACSVRVERAVHACARVQGAGQRAWVRHARRRLGKPGAHIEKIGKIGSDPNQESGDRENRVAHTAFFVRAWCPCDATAAECQLLRLWSTLSADCLYYRHAHHCYLRSELLRSRQPIYQAVWLVLSQAQILDWVCCDANVCNTSEDCTARREI